jgi:hypothetical protein
MRKWLLLSLVLIPILMISCVPTNTPAAAPVTSPITELQNWRTGMDTWKTTVADPAIAKANAAAVAANTAPLQAAIDTQKAVIAQLQADQAALTKRVTDSENKITAMATLTPSSSGGGVIPGTTGNIPQFTPGTFTGSIATSLTGQVVQQINYSTGGNILYAGTGGSNQAYYTQRFINYNSSQMFVTPKIGLSLGTQGGAYANVPQTVSNVTFTISGGSAGFYSYTPVAANYSSTNTTANFQINGSTGVMYYLMNPPLGTPSYSLQITPYYSYYKGLPLGPGQYIDINVQIYGLFCSPGATWTVAPAFDQSL